MFYMNIKKETGKIETIKIIGEDIEEITFHTFCSHCGKKLEYTESDFFESSVALGSIYKDYISNNYGSAWYCSQLCVDKAKARQDGFKLYKPSLQN